MLFITHIHINRHQTKIIGIIGMRQCANPLKHQHNWLNIVQVKYLWQKDRRERERETKCEPMLDDVEYF